MTTNQNELSKEPDAVETEVAKGEQNEVLEEPPQLEKEKIKEKPRPKPTLKTVKSTVPKVPVRRVSPRIEELAQPMMKNVLSTLRDKAWILPPPLVDNLQRIIAAKTCLNPEDAARVLRRKKRKTKKATRSPPLTKKWTHLDFIKLDTGQAPVDRNVAVCQYLLAVNFVKSILQRQCQTQRKDFREITHVILKHLMSIEGCTDAHNGNDDRATQKMHLLAEIIACWIAEILVEVAEANKAALEEYCKKKEMKQMEVDDDEETDSEAEYWEQIEQKYKTQENSEETLKEVEEGEKNGDVEDEKVEQEQKPEDVEKKDEDEQEQKPEEDVEKKGEDKEVLEAGRGGNETTET